MIVINKLPMFVNTKDNFFNTTLLKSFQNYIDNVGYIFSYKEGRKKSYKYKKEDIVGLMSKTYYITPDKEIAFLTEIINPEYEPLKTLPYPFYYVWPIMETVRQDNGDIQVGSIEGLEFIV